MTVTALKELWKLCFNDSDEFIEMYFRLRYTPENTMLLHSGEKVVAMLQCLTYPVRLAERTINAGYISGACTHPEYRKKGYMEELLHRTLKEMYSKQVPMNFLIPANKKLFDYYAKFGYTPGFFRNAIKSAVPVQAAPELSVTFSTELTDEVYRYYRQKTTQRSYFVRHTFTDLQVVLEDMKMGHTALAIARNKAQEIAGLLFAFPDSDILKIGECVADNDPIAQELAYRSANRFNCKKIVTFKAANEEGSTPFGMLRIIDAKALIAFYAETHPHVNTSFCLVDEMLPANNGYYTIEAGHMSFSETSSSTDYPTLNIDILGNLLFGHTRLYMNLMVE